MFYYFENGVVFREKKENKTSSMNQLYFWCLILCFKGPVKTQDSGIVSKG